MSYAYASEPPTKGKVILKTSMGDLEVELWPKEAPKATRNFVQLCLEGYYDNTVFHRIVKNFIVQGGDPTGTGLGGESIYNEPFADEFHSRLRFSHRGLLAMANTGRNTNTSQFFFTLDKTEDLNRKNTIFGKIVGDTIYNLLEIGEVEVEDEKPVYPIVIKSVEVLYNPFDDIETRTTAQERAAKLAEEKLKAEREANKKTKGKKNLSLLSFGDEAATEETIIKSSNVKKKIASSHDLLDDGRLSKEVIVSKDELKASTGRVDSDEKKPTSSAPAVPAKRAWEDESEEEDSDPEAAEEERAQQRRLVEVAKQRLGGSAAAGGTSKVSSVRAEIEKVQNELRQMEASRKSTQSAAKEEKPMNPLEAFRNQYKGKAIMGKRPKGGMDDSDVLRSLASFKDKLHHAAPAKKEEKEEKTCELHGLVDCKSCKRDDDDDADEEDSNWFNHELHFKRDAANVYEPVVDDYSYFDPRDPKSIDEHKRKRESAGRVESGRRDPERDGIRRDRDRDDGNRDRDRDRDREREKDRDRIDRDRAYKDRDYGRHGKNRRW